jgi:ribosomal protein L37AE/L43A
MNHERHPYVCGKCKEETSIIYADYEANVWLCEDCEQRRRKANMLHIDPLKKL